MTISAFSLLLRRGNLIRKYINTVDRYEIKFGVILACDENKKVYRCPQLFNDAERR